MLDSVCVGLPPGAEIRHTGQLVLFGHTVPDIRLGRGLILPDPKEVNCDIKGFEKTAEVGSIGREAFDDGRPLWIHKHLIGLNGKEEIGLAVVITEGDNFFARLPKFGDGIRDDFKVRHHTAIESVEIEYQKFDPVVTGGLT